MMLLTRDQTSAGQSTTQAVLPAKEESRIPFLDGLRAYSILVVLLYHTNERNHWLNPNSLLAPVLIDGQLGVRIFFVISGFLITSLLLRELDRTNQISIRGFFERRIARIFPAFYLYIVVVLVGTTLGLVSVSWVLIASSATFTQNFDVFYFHFLHRWLDTVSNKDGVLLGHFWTLTIEEQFYLIWPSCLNYLGVRRSRWLAIVCVIFFPILRFIAARWIAYPGLRTTIAERSMQDLICMGILAAFAVKYGWLQRISNLRFRAAIPWLSAATLYLICPWIESFFNSEIGTAVVPTLQGLAIVLLMLWLLSGKGGILRSALETWPAIQLGLISYSLYLWQQPITYWDRTSWISFPWNLLIPIPVAVLCYRLWELPLRSRIRSIFHQLPRWTT
jgi:peptidoglycan/LPS O-acetylase OafA/YrhL